MQIVNFLAFSLILILVTGCGRVSCFDKMPKQPSSGSQSTTPKSIVEMLRELPPAFVNRLANLLRVNTTHSGDLVKEIIKKAQDLTTTTPLPSATPTTLPKDEAFKWSYPPAIDSLRKIFGTKANLTKADLCEKLMGDIVADIIIVPAMRADEVSFIGGSVSSFIGSQLGIVVIMVSLVLNGALAIWLIASTVCCMVNRKKKNSLKKDIRVSAPSSRYSTIRRTRRRIPSFDDNQQDQ